MPEPPAGEPEVTPPAVPEPPTVGPTSPDEVTEPAQPTETPQATEPAQPTETPQATEPAVAPGGPTTEAAPSSPWWPPSTAAPPPVPPPSRRGRVIAIALAVLLVAGGGVAGIVLATSGSDQIAGQESPGTQPPASPSPTGPTLPAVPASFLVVATSGGQVDISWSAVQSDIGITGYTIYRDDETLKLVNASLTSYTDFEVVPNHTYTYAIDAVSGVGRSEQATQTITTPDAPKLSAAALVGGFTVKGSWTDENFTNYDEGDKYRSFWTFRSTCKGDRACNVKTSGDGEGSKQVLKRKGANYSGKVTIPKGGLCGSVELTEYQTFDFDVIRAKFMEGVWMATKIKGTSRFDVPASSGCISGFGVVSFTATLAS